MYWTRSLRIIKSHHSIYRQLIFATLALLTWLGSIITHQQANQIINLKAQSSSYASILSNSNPIELAQFATLVLEYHQVPAIHMLQIASIYCIYRLCDHLSRRRALHLETALAFSASLIFSDILYSATTSIFFQVIAFSFSIKAIQIATNLGLNKRFFYHAFLSIIFHVSGGILILTALVITRPQRSNIAKALWLTLASISLSLLLSITYAPEGGDYQHAQHPDWVKHIFYILFALFIFTLNNEKTLLISFSAAVLIAISHAVSFAFFHRWYIPFLPITVLIFINLVIDHIRD